MNKIMPWGWVVLRGLFAFFALFAREAKGAQRCYMNNLQLFYYFGKSANWWNSPPPPPPPPPPPIYSTILIFLLLLTSTLGLLLFTPITLLLEMFGLSRPNCGT